MKKKKKERWWTILHGRRQEVKNSLEHLALHKHVSAVLKIYANANTTVENANTVNSAWKFDTA